MTRDPFDLLECFDSSSKKRPLTTTVAIAESIQRSISVLGCLAGLLPSSRTNGAGAFLRRKGASKISAIIRENWISARRDATGRPDVAIAARSVPTAAVAASTGSDPLVTCCRCGTAGKRRVCSDCATSGYIELRCGCVERPDGTRHSCNTEVYLSDGRTFTNGHYGGAVYNAFAAWCNAAGQPNENARTSIKQPCADPVLP